LFTQADFAFEAAFARDVGAAKDELHGGARFTKRVIGGIRALSASGGKGGLSRDQPWKIEAIRAM
jgi:hypothetical protein